MREIARVRVTCTSCDYSHSISAPQDDGRPIEEAELEARSHADTHRHSTTLTPPLGAVRTYAPRNFPPPRGLSRGVTY